MRECVNRNELVIIQEIPYKDGRFRNEEQLNEYIDAGADLILVDKLDKSATGHTTLATIPAGDLEAFRDRHPAAPVVVAGGISAENVSAVVAASGAVGIDVCASVRLGGHIDEQLVGRLVSRLSGERSHD